MILTPSAVCFCRVEISSYKLPTADAQINKHSLMNGKAQIQWQSAKSNQEETAPHVSICRFQQTLLMRIFFSLRRITSNSFCPIFLWSWVHTSIAKALSGLGLIPIPKCFTANVITSPYKSHSLNGISWLLPVLFHFQFLLPWHPLVLRLHYWGVTSEHTDIDQRSATVH